MRASAPTIDDRALHAEREATMRTVPQNKRLVRHCAVMILSALVATFAALDARAWDPPDPPDGSTAADLAMAPATPTTPYPKAHGYIIQSGIDVLYSDGYWFAAQTMRTSQQELLNGVRYADVKDGRQGVVVQACAAISLICKDVTSPGDLGLPSWPYAADNHYFNPDTGNGLSVDALAAIATATSLPSQFSPGLGFQLAVDPSLGTGNFPSNLSWMTAVYGNAVAGFQGQAIPSVGGRSGPALAMFYLGWASHLMQDLTVVHHTFDEPQKHHSEYEAAADGLVVPLGAGIYEAGGTVGTLKLDTSLCPNLPAGSRACFGSYAAYKSHDANALARIDANVQLAATGYATQQLAFAASLQAGLYAAFLKDIGNTPVHMSAVVATMPSML
jgi:hypothetical protein